MTETTGGPTEKAGADAGPPGGGDPLSAVSTPTPGGPTEAPAAAAHGEHGDPHGGGHGESAASKGKAKALAAMGAFGRVFGMARTVIQDAGRGLFASVVSFPLLLVKGDFSTRLLIVGFFASMALVAMTGSQLLHKIAPGLFVKHHAGLSPEAEALIEDEKHLKEVSGKLLFLERFNGLFEGEKGGPHSAGYEFELYVEADQPATSVFLKGHLPEARESVGQVLGGRTYDELLSEAGKNALKKDILDAVNRVLAHLKGRGSVKRVYFTKFMMN